ncbi:MAG: MFS transporter [Acetobacteraceae bacterium]|nr:MFS transporter [Acetobacteraceae bacterium]
MSGASLTRLAPAEHHYAPPAPMCTRPFVGITAVLLGAVISTLYSRITTFGLADLRGAVHAGFDEGAWITTASTVGQMCIGPLAAWLGLVFGPRRVLMISAGVFAATSALIPLSPNLPTLLVGQSIGGLSSGTFIPLTIGFVLQSLKPEFWPYGLAAYGLNLELSLNIPASLEGFYLDHLSWRWIFWQGSILAVPMLACIHFGIPKSAVNRDAVRNADFWGMFYAASGFSMVYAALDQGNRLDWLNSGLVCGLLLGGLVMLAAFVLQILLAEHPWINPGFLLRRNIALVMAILVLYRFIVLSTSYVIPQYLTTIQNFRSLEVGKVLVWIAVPQFLLAPLIATALRWLDPRIMLAAGLGAVGIACWMASGVTRDWATDDFLPSQILQAFGQSAALIALLLFAVRHLRPADALTFGVLLQTARLLGGEIGNAFMQTFVRVREQVASNLVGLHVQSGGISVNERLDAYTGGLLAQSEGLSHASARAASLLSQAVRNQANVLSYEDGFTIVALAVVAMLLLTAFLGPPPVPEPPPAPEGAGT